MRLLMLALFLIFCAAAWVSISRAEPPMLVDAAVQQGRAEGLPQGSHALRAVPGRHVRATTEKECRMTGLAAGIGAKAALSSIPWKLIGYIGVGLAVVAFVLLAFHWKHQASDRADKLATICQATRSAANNPKMKCSEVPAQIGFMHDTINVLHGAIEKQNAAVDALGAKSKADQAAAAEASRNAQARARGAESTVERLKASAKAGGASGALCKPSKVVEEIWK